MKTADTTKSWTQLNTVTGGVPIRYPLRMSETLLRGFVWAKMIRGHLRVCWRTVNA